MAILISPISRFSLLPKRFESLNEKLWYITDVSLELTFLDEDVVLAPKVPLTVSHSDFMNFTSGLKKYIEQLYTRSPDADPIDSYSTFEFIPMETGFTFSCFDGEVDDYENGDITVQIMINLESFGESLPSSYMGCTTEIDVKSILTFVQKLDEEVRLMQ